MPSTALKLKPELPSPQLTEHQKAWERVGRDANLRASPALLAELDREERVQAYHEEQAARAPVKRWRPVAIPRKGHPMVKILFMEMNRQRVGIREMARRAEISHESLSSWRKLMAPRIDLIERCFNILGLTLMPIPQDLGYHYENAIRHIGSAMPRKGQDHS